MGFASGDVRRLERGGAVIRSLDKRAREELAHVGVVYVDARPEDYIERFRDIERFEDGPSVLRMGRLGTPPRIEDLQSLTLSAQDLAELPACRPGRCEMKLSSDAMARFQSEVDWSAPQAGRQADEVMRRTLLDLVRSYQAEGEAPAHGESRREQLPPSAYRHRASRRLYPVWTWERANRTLALSTASTGGMSLCREGAEPGSARCSTMLAPTAATPDTGFAERLPPEPLSP